MIAKNDDYPSGGPGPEDEFPEWVHHIHREFIRWIEPVLFRERVRRMHRYPKWYKGYRQRVTHPHWMRRERFPKWKRRDSAPARF